MTRSQKNFYNRKCKQCGGQIQNKNSKFCCRECYWEYKRNNEYPGQFKKGHAPCKIIKESKYPLESFVCPVCGKNFKKRITKKKRPQAVYCCQKCAYKGRSLGFTKRRIENGYNVEKKQHEKICSFCGKEYKTTKKTQKYCCRKCFEGAHRKNMAGDKNPSWKGGTTYKNRGFRGPYWDEIRKECYKRDNYVCQDCGVKCIGKAGANKETTNKIIQCHHIKGFESEKDNKIDNLVTLCLSCHLKRHGKNYEMD